MIKKHSIYFILDIFTHFAGILSSEDVFHILLLLIASSWIMGRMFKFFRLPIVLGDILAGVIISPVLIHLSGSHSVEEVIIILAELGIFFLMLHSGLDTNISNLSSRLKPSIIIALSGIIPIFTSLFCVFHFLFPLGNVLQEIFLSLVLCLNSIPILISFLNHHGLRQKLFGHLVIGSTIVNELLLFIGVSFLFIFAEKGELSWFMGGIILIKVIAFFIGTLFLGKIVLPLFRPIFNTKKNKAFTFTLIIALIFALFAESIGLHIILGAYLGGMFVREQMQNDKQFQKIEDRLFGLSYSFLGPIFFVSVGMAISFDSILQTPLLFFIVFGIVMGWQLIGSGIATYFLHKRHFSKKQSAALALTLSGRGGTEIIVAQVGMGTIIAGTGTPLLDSNGLSLVVLISFFATLLIPFGLRWLLGEEKR